MLHYPLARELSNKARNYLGEAIERTYKTRQIQLMPDVLCVEFTEPVSQREFDDLMQQLLYICDSLNDDRLFEQEIEQVYSDNPMLPLLSNGDVVKLADGLFMYQGTFWRVFQALHTKIRELAEQYEAIEQEYPALWPVDLYKKINYFKEFPQQVILCTTVQDTHQARSRFASQYESTSEFQHVDVQEYGTPSQFGLQSAVCDVCYYALSRSHDHHNTTYTTYNKVFRNESSKIDSLDRLIAFSVRDIMFVGDRQYVLDRREQLIEDLKAFLTALKLHSRIETANDPFFTNDSVIKSVFQNASGLKYELLARLNFSGTDLAVGSINLHLDYFGKAFDIKTCDGSEVYSGCVGIGFERLTYALYCQYGPNVPDWPEDLKVYLDLQDLQ